MNSDIGLVAAIGLGSNSVRLLIAEVAGPHLASVERLETITRLSAYSGYSGRAPLLSGEAIGNTRAAAVNFARHARERNARLVGVLATEAVRAAANRRDLLDPLRNDLGLDITVISGEQEAKLGWQAISSGYEPGVSLGVIDIGGASTDLSAGPAGCASPGGVASIKVGARTTMTRFALDEPVPPGRMASELDLLGMEIGSTARVVDPRPQVAVVIGGTATVLAEVYPTYAGLAGGSVERDWLENWVLDAATLDIRGRAAAGVPPDLADIAVAGGAILLSVLDAWGLDRFHASQRNILDGFIERSLAGQNIL